MNTENNKTERIIQRMLADRSTDAPGDAIKYAKNLYRTRAAEPRASLVRRVLAVMQVDLAPNRAAFGERSASGSQARQMLFDAGENAVDLRVITVNNGFDIRGQVLGEGFENGEAEIVNDEISNKVKVDKMSGFKVSGLPAGKYRLTIKGENAEIVLEELELK
jgi:hypothetical protein